MCKQIVNNNRQIVTDVDIKLTYDKNYQAEFSELRFFIYLRNILTML